MSKRSIWSAQYKRLWGIEKIKPLLSRDFSSGESTWLEKLKVFWSGSCEVIDKFNQFIFTFTVEYEDNYMLSFLDQHFFADEISYIYL